MSNITKPVVKTLTWAAASDLELDLPNDGFITEVELELSLTMDGSIAGDVHALGIWRALQGLKIEGGDGKVYFSMAGTQMGMLLHYFNLIDFPRVNWHEIIATTQVMKWRIHFGSRPLDVYGRRNPFDLTCAIPAFMFSYPKLTWTTTANNALSVAQVISSGTMRVSVHMVLPTREAIANWSRKVPVSSSESYDPGATATNYTAQRNVPTGNFVRRIGIMALDATATGSNGPLNKSDQMTEVGVFLGKANRWITQQREQQLRLENPLFDGLQLLDAPNTLSPYDVPGFYNLDLRRYEHPDFGLDARTYPGHPVAPGDVVLGMTIGAYASAEKEHIWYDQVQDFQS